MFFSRRVKNTTSMFFFSHFFPKKYIIAAYIGEMIFFLKNQLVKKKIVKNLMSIFREKTQPHLKYFCTFCMQFFTIAPYTEEMKIFGIFWKNQLLKKISDKIIWKIDMRFFTIFFFKSWFFKKKIKIFISPV